jgi:hypothetical protein
MQPAIQVPDAANRYSGQFGGAVPIDRVCITAKPGCVTLHQYLGRLAHILATCGIGETCKGLNSKKHG